MRTPTKRERERKRLAPRDVKDFTVKRGELIAKSVRLSDNTLDEFIPVIDRDNAMHRPPFTRQPFTLCNISRRRFEPSHKTPHTEREPTEPAEEPSAPGIDLFTNEPGN
jgi:hypothetical protein